VSADLRCCVVVPARDEEKLIGACLDALAAQRGVEPGAWEVIVVLDACRDDTRGEVQRAAARHPALTLTELEGPGQGSGSARRVGMDAACERLAPDGLIASTDADSRVAPDWVAAQLAAVARGVRAIGGRIELFPDDGERLGLHVLADRAARQSARHQAVMRDPGPPGSTAEHWQFSGASLAVTAEVYRQVGGIAPHASLEDEAFERALIARGVPIERSLAVRVHTSGRLDGRAARGLSADLAAASGRCGTARQTP
jgi:glucosyl-3-phosphoglycerate synthase